MTAIELTQVDRDWIDQNHPSLEILNTVPISITGEISFQASYDIDRGEFNAENCTSRFSLLISGKYRIAIVLADSDNSPYPKLYEIGGRIPCEPDRHINNDQVACLHIKGEEYKEIREGEYAFKKYIDYLVIPFLYAQEFYEMYSFYPWGEYSHGAAGISEANGSSYNCKYPMIKAYIKKSGKIKSSVLCPCGSKKPFLECHKDIYEGILKLREDLKTKNRLNGQ